MTSVISDSLQPNRLPSSFLGSSVHVILQARILEWVAVPSSRRHEFDPWSQKDPLEKEMATHFSILAWEILWTEEPGRLQSMGSQKSQTQLSN